MARPTSGAPRGLRVRLWPTMVDVWSKKPVEEHAAEGAPAGCGGSASSGVPPLPAKAADSTEGGGWAAGEKGDADGRLENNSMRSRDAAATARPGRLARLGFSLALRVRP